MPAFGERAAVVEKAVSTVADRVVDLQVVAVAAGSMMLGQSLR